MIIKRFLNHLIWLHWSISSSWISDFFALPEELRLTMLLCTVSSMSCIYVVVLSVITQNLLPQVRVGMLIDW